MAAKRYVFLDPDGMAESTWLYVIVDAPTGVIYQQQYGGTACRHGNAEGFLVPVAGSKSLPDLRELFEKHLRGAGTRNYEWPEPERTTLRHILSEILYWECDGTKEELHPLRLDEARISEADEAWVPVTTPDGPGFLVWPNSD